MKKNLLAGFVSLLVLPGFIVVAAEPEKGFKPLFDGKTLKGWSGDPALWSVKDGAIVGQTTREHPARNNTFLISKTPVSDFELHLSYKIIGGNSGIQYRSRVVDEDKWIVGGYQADFEAGTSYSGILYDERGERSIMAMRGEKVTWTKDCTKKVTGSVGDSKEIQDAINKEEWNEYIVIARGNHLQHFINGKLTVDVTDECESKRVMKGILALQIHQGPPMTVMFKNIELKELK
jgi:hypothetical protein